MAQVQLVGPPTDGISSLNFAPSSDLLLVTSWDTGVRLYDARANTGARSYYHHRAAVLDGALADDTTAFSGGLDKAVTKYDTATETMSSLGEHDDAVRCVEVSSDLGAVVTGSWDGSVRVWDPRAATALQHTIEVPGKVYSLAMGAAGQNMFVVGTSERSIQIFDTRSLPAPAQTRESSLKFQTRCIRMFPDGEGFAVSSIEGRVAIEFVAPDEDSQKKKYAFKCHRAKVGDTEHVYPVNALAFHPGFGTFATGGCDGLVNIWDARAKKRLCRLPKMPVGIAALDFNHDGSLLAIASSYTYEEGDKEHGPDAVVVRTVAEAEVKPKPKKKSG